MHQSMISNVFKVNYDSTVNMLMQYISRASLFINIMM